MSLFSRLNNQTLLSLMDAIWSVDENFHTEEKFKHLDDTIVRHENIVHALEARNEEAFEAANADALLLRQVFQHEQLCRVLNGKPSLRKQKRSHLDARWLRLPIHAVPEARKFSALCQTCSE